MHEESLNCKIGTLRKKLADKLKINFIDCLLINQGVEWEHEEDQVILRSKVCYTYPIITIKRAEPLLLASNHPRNKFAQNNDNIELIFKLLTRESVHYTQACWELLTYLPKNQRIERDIVELNLERGWDSLLESHSIYRLLYGLQIVVEVLKKEKKKKGGEKWSEAFVSKGGGNHLLNCLLNVPMKSPLSRKCFALLLEIIASAFSEEQLEEIEQYKTKKNVIIFKILSAMEEFTKPSIEHKPQEKEELDFFEQSEYEVDNNDANAVKSGFEIIKGTFREDYNYFEQIAKYPNFLDLMRNGIILSANKTLRKNFTTEIYNVCKDYEKFVGLSFAPHKVITDIMINVLLDDVASSQNTCKEYYDLLYKILELFSRELFLQVSIDYLGMIKRFANMLITHTSVESNAKEVDTKLTGILKLLDASLTKFPEYKLIIGQNNLLDELLHKCLLDYPISGNRSIYVSGNPLPPKCKSKLSRDLAFELLSVLAYRCEENLNVILNYLPALHLTEPWRINSLDDWDMTSPIYEKSDTGYMGIKNPGCICYMNSLLQQLYMIPSFRNSIVSARRTDPAGELPTDPMLVQLQHLFTSLHESVKQYYNPRNFCHEFKDWEGNSINLGEQMDVDEFFNMLMDKLEGALKETNESNLVKEHFGSVYLNQIICRDCPHKRELEEPFLAINLQIKNKTSLEESIRSFVEGEVMEGNNAYQCDRCDKKVSAVKRVCIKSLADNLIFVLKRFSYNYDTMQKVKLNDYCEFPMKINMSPYMVDPEDKATQNNEYKLVGVVIHRGIADSGHYYSFIQERDNNNEWFEFNDTIVSSFDIEKIKDEAFGGEDQWDDGSRKHRAERHCNAYMVFYERIIPTMTRSTSFNAYSEIRGSVIQENIKYWQAKFFLSKDYFTFVNYLGQKWIGSEIKPSDWRPSPDSLLNVFKYITAVMTTTFMRARTTKFMYDLYDTMVTYIDNCLLAAEWLVWEFTNKKVFDEYLLGTAPSNVSLAASGLIARALKKLCTEERKSVKDGKQCIAVNFLNFLVSMLNNRKEYRKRSYQQLFSKITMIGPEAREHLKKLNAIERIISLLRDEDISNSIVPYTPNPMSSLSVPEGYEIQKISGPNGMFDWSFMVHSLCVLLRSCKLIREESPQTLQPTTQIDDASIVFNMVEGDVIRKIFCSCRCRVGYNSYFKAVAHVAWEMIDIKNRLRKELIQILDEVEQEEVDICIKPMVILADFNDRSSLRFVKDMLDDINEVAEKYKYSYYFTYAVATSLMKACKKSRVVQDEMKKSETEFRWLKDYFIEIPYAPTPEPGWTIKYYKSEEMNEKQLEKNNHYYLSQMHSYWREKTNAFIQEFKRYVEDEDVYTEEDFVDSDEDLYEENLCKGEVVEYLLKREGKSGKWVQAIVEKHTGAHLQISYKNDGKEFTTYIDPASDLLAKKGTHEVTNDLDQSSTCKENPSDDCST